MGYVVKAPYVTLRVRDERGAVTLLGFYAGAVVPDGVEQDSLDKHLESGMVVEEGTAEAEAVSPVGGPVDFDESGSPVTADEPASPAAAAPAKSASKAEWVDYAVSQGMSREDAEKASKDDLVAAFGAS